MAPPDERAVKAIIRAHRSKSRSQEAKLAFAVHAFFLAEGYKPVAVGKRADEAAPEESLTEEVDLDGWDDTGDVFAVRYLPEDGRPEHGLQVKMQAMGDTLLVHWQPVASAEAPSTLELRTPDYVAEASNLDDVDGYKNLQQLLNQLDRALHVAPPTEQAAAASAGNSLMVAAGRQAPTGGLDEPLERPSRPAPDEARPSGDGADELHADGRLPPPLPDGQPDDDWPEPEGMVPRPLVGPPGGVIEPPPTAPGAADLVPPGLRAPGTSGGFGMPHIMPGPGLEPFGGGGGGMLVGPGDPMFAGRMRVPPAGGRGASPGVRFDPIGPRGMPGWNPDDFRRGGPGNPQGPPHPDIQPPGPGRGTDFDSMFG